MGRRLHSCAAVTVGTSVCYFGGDLFILVVGVAGYDTNFSALLAIGCGDDRGDITFFVQLYP